MDRPTIFLVSISAPDFNEECPSNLFKCPVEVGLCLPYSAACDGYSNCGARDAGDEKDCDSFETVTDLVDNCEFTGLTISKILDLWVKI